MKTEVGRGKWGMDVLMNFESFLKSKTFLLASILVDEERRLKMDEGHGNGSCWQAKGEVVWQVIEGCKLEEEEICAG
jgi:hypothetical protein